MPSELLTTERAEHSGVKLDGGSEVDVGGARHVGAIALPAAIQRRCPVTRAFKVKLRPWKTVPPACGWNGPADARRSPAQGNGSCCPSTATTFDKPVGMLVMPPLTVPQATSEKLIGTHGQAAHAGGLATATVRLHGSDVIQSRRALVARANTAPSHNAACGGQRQVVHGAGGYSNGVGQRIGSGLETSRRKPEDCQRTPQLTTEPS